jgi:4-hydroxy-2-oxoheptanedioate aldolase
MTVENAVKSAAATGKRVRGVHLDFPAPAIIEVMGREGHDFLYIDGEHGNFDWRDIEVACITAERHGMTPIARTPDTSAATITHFLDRGVKGIIVPHVESVEEAKRVVDAVYFAPLGNRSYGSSRPEKGIGLSDKAAYFAEQNRTISLSIMIESRACLEVAAEIAALEGVEYLSFGMYDLCQALGHPGRPDHPEVKAAVEKAAALIRAKGKRLREDFISFAMINELLVAGARQLLKT